jgi:hypothetical protein
MITDIETGLSHELPDPAAFSDALEGGLRMLADLEHSLERLDAVLLTGRPHAIADAAKAMELSFATAEPAFQRIVVQLETFGATRLRDAAQQLRRADQTTAAAAADSLRTALKRFVKRNDACYRRAQGLGRGLSASLRTIHGLGLTGNGRLIAEA